ncbi:MAG TPA: HemK/PrmC family methyltransferase [Candidatus Saccharimonadales bacterium]|nr:HemK/PrmC family methyltransferase [Candidatus Saccharimonadales bacterium]
MRVDEWLKSAEQRLSSAGIGTARLDCLVLLEDATVKDRSYLLAHPEITIQGGTLQRLKRQLNRRTQHEPMSYIRGKTEFYGREFIINQDVLEPRPESEAMMESLKNLKLPNKSTILDLGTGSGALAITAKLEIPEAEVIATDIDPKCLKVARENATKHQTEITFTKGDLLKPILSSKLWTLTSIIMANLPYVPDDFKLNEAAKNEPKLAIFGGQDGLDIYRKLFEQISSSKHKPSFVLTESLPFQHAKLAKVAVKAGYKLAKTDDFIQLYTLKDN